MKKHYETHVEDTDKLISVAGPILEYKSWYEQYRKLMEEQAQRKYGLYTPTSEGDDDDFPSIPGMIARYSALGLTNEQMKENPVWKDLTGNDHDLQMKNFAWSEMSGVGGYVVNFKTWIKVVDRGEFTITDSKIHITKSNIASFPVVYTQQNNNKFQIKVTGVNSQHVIKVNGANLLISEDGYYTIDKMGYIGFGTAEILDSCDITIEQLPLYPGFILGDGVDDFAVTEKELNFEDTYTVYTAFIPFQNNPTKNMMMAGKNIKDFYMNYSSLKALSYYSGNKSVVINLSNGFNLLCCKRDADNMTIKNLITGDSVTATANEFINNPGLYYLWRVTNGYSYARPAIAGQTICNGYFSTDEDDEKVLDWYKKQYSWLFFDQAWTVTGKTNEDEDRATIANITGNGNNLVLSNFGFAEGSGYNEEGEYAGYLVTDGVDDNAISMSFEIGKNFTIIGEWKFMDNIITRAGIVKSPSLFVYNANDGLKLFINSTNKASSLNTRTLKAICSDGRVYSDDWSEMLVNEEQSITSSKSGLLIGINGNHFAKIALKNIAIYNDQLLSKEDCIKAYNYLQTLKAK